VPEQRLRASGRFPEARKTPVNAEWNSLSNRFQTQQNEDHQQKRLDQSNFNKFLGGVSGALTNRILQKPAVAGTKTL
jgi:hypothetical protein